MRTNTAFKLPCTRVTNRAVSAERALVAFEAVTFGVRAPLLGSETSWLVKTGNEVVRGRAAPPVASFGPNRAYVVYDFASCFVGRALAAVAWFFKDLDGVVVVWTGHALARVGVGLTRNAAPKLDFDVEGDICCFSSELGKVLLVAGQVFVDSVRVEDQRVGLSWFACEFKT